MNLSLNWIKKYVNLDGLTPQEIALKLTMATAEVEEVKHIEYNFKNIFICDITEVEENKEDIKLKNVIVKVGNKTYKTVCGAPNVTKGMKSVFALPGAIIDGKPLKAIDNYKGYSSEGILVSVQEIGMLDSHVEIMSVPGDEVSGKALSDIFPSEDYIIEIDNKSLTHRPDLWGHYGFARELSAVYNLELKPLILEDMDKYKLLPQPKVKIIDYENCPRYSCVYLDKLNPEPSPMWMQYDLLEAGVRPISLPVDLTNYISLEIGQPMHAFDGDKIDEIIINKMGKDSSFVTLDDSERKMLKEDLMIFNSETPVAIAGIMGGVNTEVSATTKKITLESANFYASRIRRTSTRLGLRTDASQRYEKSQPHPNTVLGIKRYVALCKSIKPDIEVISSLFDDKAKGLSDTIEVNVNKKYLNERISVDIPIETVTRILTSLGFTVKDNKEYINVLVPPFRSQKDISIPEDIVEEVARVYGYDNIEMELPAVKLSRYHWNIQRSLERKIKLYLAATCGVSEVQSYPWFDENWCNEIGFSIPDCSMALANYTAKNLSNLRTTLIPNALKMADNNSAFYEKVKLFEMGKVYKASGKGSDEHQSLCIVFASRDKTSESLFSEMKGLLRSLFKYLFNSECSFVDTKEPSMTVSMDIVFNKKEVGSFCIPDNKFLSAFRKGVRLSYCELNINELSQYNKKEIVFEEPHKFPGTWLDFSIVTDKSFLELTNILDKYKNEVIISRDFSLIYEGKGLSAGEKSYTFRYTLNYKDHTPSGEEINEFKENFVNYLNKNGLKLR